MVVQVKLTNKEATDLVQALGEYFPMLTRISQIDLMKSMAKIKIKGMVGQIDVDLSLDVDRSG